MSGIFAMVMGSVIGWNLLWPLPDGGWHIVQVALFGCAIVCYVRAVQAEK